MPNPLISVIILSYNEEKYIKSCIKSVLQQTYSNFELIIVDDASTDNTLNIIKKFKDPRIRLFVFSTNHRALASYKKGISLVRGKWITFLDGDDQFSPQRLEYLVPIAEEAGTNFFIADDIKHCLDAKELKNCVSTSFHNPYTKINIPYKGIKDYDNLKEFLINPVAIKPLIPLNHIIKHNIYIGQNPVTPLIDFDFWYYLFKTGLTLRLYNNPLFMYRMRPGSMSTKKNIMTNIYLKIYKKWLLFFKNDLEMQSLIKKKLVTLKFKQEYFSIIENNKLKRIYKLIKLLILIIQQPTTSLNLIQNFIQRAPTKLRYNLACWYYGAKKK